MNYKDYARSPNYGRIFAYDKDGNQVQELDILNLVLVLPNGQESRLKDILIKAEQVPMLFQAQNDVRDQIAKVNDALAQKDNQIAVLKQAIVELAHKIDADKI